MAKLPEDVLSIIFKKRETEWHDRVIGIFEEFIIPYLYYASATFYDPMVTTLANLSLSSCYKAKHQFESHFVLVAVRRLCKRLANDVSHGAYNDVFGGINRYKQNKYKRRRYVNIERRI